MLDPLDAAALGFSATKPRVSAAFGAATLTSIVQTKAEDIFMINSVVAHHRGWPERQEYERPGRNKGHVPKGDEN